jgi:photosystem II stability/assembly factor-like uncharacterized protein
MNYICCLAFLVIFQFLSYKQALESPKASHLPDNQQQQNRNKSVAAINVFKSTDGGKTWQGISKELPGPVKDKYGVSGNGFFANDNGIYLTDGNGLYHSKPYAPVPFWTKMISPEEPGSIAPGKPGIFAYNYWGVNLKTTNGTSVWSPIFEKIQVPRVRSVFETAAGTIFIPTDTGIFKTADTGKTWKIVYAGGLIGNLAESNGVLLATSTRRIIRSTDNGENWTVVSTEGSLVFDVKPIKGGFAAITASSELDTRRLMTSYDAGKTWQLFNASRQDKVLSDSIWRTWNDRPHVQAFTTSIIQVGENFFCTHPEGIFRSSDKGKTWKLLLPSVKDKVFNLFVSGNVIYAVLSKRGC